MPALICAAVSISDLRFFSLIVIWSHHCRFNLRLEILLFDRTRQLITMRGMCLEFYLFDRRRPMWRFVTRFNLRLEILLFDRIISWSPCDLVLCLLRFNLRLEILLWWSVIRYCVGDGQAVVSISRLEILSLIDFNLRLEILLFDRVSVNYWLDCQMWLNCVSISDLRFFSLINARYNPNWVLSSDLRFFNTLIAVCRFNLRLEILQSLTRDSSLWSFRCFNLRLEILLFDRDSSRWSCALTMVATSWTQFQSQTWDSSLWSYEYIFTPCVQLAIGVSISDLRFFSLIVEISFEVTMRLDIRSISHVSISDLRFFSLIAMTDSPRILFITSLWSSNAAASIRELESFNLRLEILLFDRGSRMRTDGVRFVWSAVSISDLRFFSLIGSSQLEPRVNRDRTKFQSQTWDSSLWSDTSANRIRNVW